MLLLIKDKQLLKIYNKIWNKVSSIIFQNVYKKQFIMEHF